MPDYYPQIFQSSDLPLYNFSVWQPDLVVVSLGGNDYNHQGGNVPSNETFTEATINFLLKVISLNLSKILLYSVCIYKFYLCIKNLPHFLSSTPTPTPRSSPTTQPQQSFKYVDKDIPPKHPSTPTITVVHHVRMSKPVHLHFKSNIHFMPNECIIYMFLVMVLWFRIQCWGVMGIRIGKGGGWWESLWGRG